ncbi:uncharacterized protein [Haliotis asinina]|uniref:uncharacterized protein n=1 Tax=Haliotis asinina TaxID=109174 RepID=UPI0035323438
MNGIKRLDHKVQFNGERDAAAAIQHDIIDILRQTPVTSNTFNLGDYGVADVSISMDLIRAIIGEIRCLHGHDVEISVLYEDTYKNDYNTLFHKLYGPVCDPPSYIGDDTCLFTSACATNFYKQCVPSKSMDMILCFIALHWLSSPVDLNGYVTSNLFLNTMARNAAMKIAADDWNAFLHCRARELKKGGHLVCSIPIQDPEFLNGNGVSSADGLCTVFNVMLWTYCRQGKITEAEMKKAVLKEYFRTVKEIRQPFDDLSSPIIAIGLKLSRLDVKQIECQHKTTWRQRLMEDGIDDHERFANSIGEMVRVWTHGTMESALSTTRRAAEKDDLLDDFYTDLKHHLLDYNPETFNSEYLLAYVFIEKV